MMTGPTNPSPYVAETLALLGEQDPLAVMEGTIDWLHSRLDRLRLPEWGVPEAPGKWTLAQVVAHLADAELAYGWRLRLVLTQDNPPLPGYDQNAWVAAFEYADADPLQSLETFAALRRWNLRLWRRLAPAELARTGVHPQRGPESLELIRRLVAGHDLRHRRQIERLIAVLG
jgi:hypothetical protein